MNLTIDANAAQTAAAARTRKLSRVESTAQKQTTAKTETSKIRKYDTVELSSGAKKYLSEDSGSQTVETAASETAGLTAETETVNSSQLYSYTDDELDDLLDNGDITQLEYNTEMGKRSSGAEE